MNAENVGIPLEQVKKETVSIELEYEAKINFAHQQNDIPFIRQIRIHNKSLDPLHEVQLRVWGEPDFPSTFEARIDQIHPEGTYNLNTVSLLLQPQKLLDIRERENGLLHIDIIQDNQVVAARAFPFELYAYNEWCGLDTLPEILSSFVMPNQESVEETLTQTREILKSRTEDSSIPGYQKGSTRVLEIVKALYSGIQSQNISYINPPASFEKNGQKVRFPDQVYRLRSGTCLDLALYFASCLEQCGLNALVILVEGHAFTGVWLVDCTFPEAAVGDCIRLRKRVDIGEILLFETTSITNTQRQTPFEEACVIGRNHLSEDSRFQFAVDVRASRIRRIRPLSIRSRTVDQESASTMTKQSSSNDKNVNHTIPENSAGHASVKQDELPANINSVHDSVSSSQAVPAEDIPSRIARWKRKLLDLSLRNRMLNFKETKKSVPILCPDLASLEDALAKGESFQIFPQEAMPFTVQDPRDPKTHFEQTGQDGLIEYLKEGFARGFICSTLSEKELEAHLIEMYRESRVSLEEGGVNTLFLALGFLSWRETGKSENRLAPLILIPLRIARPSVNEGFRIRMLEDEPRINVTLLQKIKTDYDIQVDGIDPLPQDEHGVDIPAIFRRFKEAIINIEGWEIKELSYVGHFSFTKFLLWYDLEKRLGALTQNPVVQHLVARASEPYQDGISFPECDTLDEKYPPKDVYCITDADSSQLSAILAAARGKTFVLQGPPGTGKSQTITNMIAQCLAEGKRVLFVSAKMAALNVVHDRLCERGLEPFCLELHSSKTDKRHFLSQLEKVLTTGRQSTTVDWESSTTDLLKLRQDLNRYAGLIREPRLHGNSPFQILSKLIGFENTPYVKIAWDEVKSVTTAFRETVNDSLDRLRAALNVIGDVPSHPWQSSNIEICTPNLEDSVIQRIGELRQTVSSLSKAIQECSSTLLFEEKGWSQNDIRGIANLANFLLHHNCPTQALLRLPQWETYKPRIKDWIETGRRRDNNRAVLFQQFKETLLSLDLDLIHEQLELSQKSRFPMSFYYAWKASRILKASSAKKTLPGKQELLSLVKTAQSVVKDQKSLANTHDDARQLLGGYWNNAEADWKQVEESLDWVGSFRNALSLYQTDHFELRQKQKERWIEYAIDSRDLVSGRSAAGQALKRIVQLSSLLTNQQKELTDLLQLDELSAWGNEHEKNYLERMNDQFQHWHNRIKELYSWSGFVQARNQINQLGLEPLIQGLVSGDFSSEQLLEVYEHSFYRWALDVLYEEEPMLTRFQGYEHQRQIDQFAQKDKRLSAKAQAHIASRLSENIPNAEHASTNSVVGIVSREIKKKTRHIPIRRLLSETKQLIATIKPCFLMSPLSVVQFLDSDFPIFDLVIFDEASQLPVWDAISSLARGKQAVIVGDSRQLPPTNFFDKMDNADDIVDEDEIEDLESILDECEASGFEQYRLQWHYRSRHEHLIAFSNYHYYDNKLITFPSSLDKSPTSGVQLRYLENGIYDRGKSCTNRAEAEAIVHEITSRLKDPASQNYSIGVVTLNQAQQRLIEDLLDQARRDNSDIERFFSSETPEPIIVKNLENVQGDERDVVMLSITYGPDTTGRIMMNFGPLGKTGGERRLNVAITRAKQQVLVFSSLRHDQMNLSRTGSIGVQHLKIYLDYAGRGPKAISEAVQSVNINDFDSPFEKDVCSQLEKRGWIVHRQIGCSGYRIDLAVVHPKDQGRYLLGLECDGATYHSSKVARDRDRLRESVLRNLGWEIHRIWSSDWLRNKDREIQEIEKKLNHLNTKPIQYHAGFIIDTKPPQTSRTNGGGVSGEVIPKSTKLPGQKEFTSYQCNSILGDLEAFNNPRNNTLIREKIVEIVQVEGPILYERLAKKVLLLWGISRLGSRVNDRIRQLMPLDRIQVISSFNRSFVSLIDFGNPIEFGFRIPSPDDKEKRGIEEIPTFEITNAAYALLQQMIRVPVNELIAETARCFGFQRTTENMRLIIQQSITELTSMKRCELDNDDVCLT